MECPSSQTYKNPKQIKIGRRLAIKVLNAAKFVYSFPHTEGAPVTPGLVPAGSVRVVATRTVASVPGCPDWSANSDMNYTNGTSPNFGCGVNSNLAAMVADPEHLLQGAAGTGDTVVMSSTKAIATYRNQTPTGAEGLAKNGTEGN